MRPSASLVLLLGLLSAGTLSGCLTASGPTGDAEPTLRDPVHLSLCVFGDTERNIVIQGCERWVDSWVLAGPRTVNISSNNTGLLLVVEVSPPGPVGSIRFTTEDQEHELVLGGLLAPTDVFPHGDQNRQNGTWLHPFVWSTCLSPTLTVAPDLVQPASETKLHVFDFVTGWSDRDREDIDPAVASCNGVWVKDWR